MAAPTTNASAGGTVTIIATIFPAPRKKDLVLASLQSLSTTVHANEPDCLEYSIHTDTASDEVFVLEKFKSMEALMKHGEMDYMTDFKKKGEELGALAKENKIRVMRSAGGFGQVHIGKEEREIGGKRIEFIHM